MTLFLPIAEAAHRITAGGL